MAIPSISDEAMYEAIAKYGISRRPGIYISPILVGAALDFVLGGIMLAQLVTYCSSSKRDKPFNRIVVGISCFLACATSIFTICYLNHLFAYNFGRYLPFVSWDWLNWYALLDVATTTTVSIFYTERAYHLYHRSNWILLLVAPFMLAALAGAIGAKVVAGSYLTDSTQADQLKPYFFLWIGGDLVMGLLLTGLILHRLVVSKTGAGMDRVIDRLIYLSLESQVPVTLTAIAFLVSYSIESNSAMNVLFELYHPKISVVGMLAVLNSRHTLRKVLHPADDISTKEVEDLSSIRGLDETGMSMATDLWVRDDSTGFVVSRSG